MVSFNSYVKLLEGNHFRILEEMTAQTLNIALLHGSFLLGAASLHLEPPEIHA